MKKIYAPLITAALLAGLSGIDMVHATENEEEAPAAAS